MEVLINLARVLQLFCLWWSGGMDGFLFFFFFFFLFLLSFFLFFFQYSHSHLETRERGSWIRSTQPGPLALCNECGRAKKRRKQPKIQCPHKKNSNQTTIKQLKTNNWVARHGQCLPQGAFHKVFSERHCRKVLGRHWKGIARHCERPFCPRLGFFLSFFFLLLLSSSSSFSPPPSSPVCFTLPATTRR